nr:FlaG family protein [Helicobacter sp. 12S02634-8]
MDKIQGSSFSSLQDRLVSLVHNAGRPAAQTRDVPTTQADTAEEISAYHEDKQKDALKQELLLLSSALNQEMKRINTDINFNYNDDIRGLVVTVKEENGDKIIREIPSKEAIELMKKMHDIVGLIFDKKG